MGPLTRRCYRDPKEPSGRRLVWVRDPAPARLDMRRSRHTRRDGRRKIETSFAWGGPLRRAMAAKVWERLVDLAAEAMVSGPMSGATFHALLAEAFADRRAGKDVLRLYRDQMQALGLIQVVRAEGARSPIRWVTIVSLEASCDPRGLWAGERDRRADARRARDRAAYRARRGGRVRTYSRRVVATPLALPPSVKDTELPSIGNILDNPNFRRLSQRVLKTDEDITPRGPLGSAFEQEKAKAEPPPLFAIPPLRPEPPPVATPPPARAAEDGPATCAEAKRLLAAACRGNTRDEKHVDAIRTRLGPVIWKALREVAEGAVLGWVGSGYAWEADDRIARLCGRLGDVWAEAFPGRPFGDPGEEGDLGAPPWRAYRDLPANPEAEARVRDVWREAGAGVAVVPLGLLGRMDLSRDRYRAAFLAIRASKQRDADKAGWAVLTHLEVATQGRPPRNGWTRRRSAA